MRLVEEMADFEHALENPSKILSTAAAEGDYLPRLLTEVPNIFRPANSARSANMG